jgi:hypothetical protein
MTNEGRNELRFLNIWPLIEIPISNKYAVKTRNHQKIGELYRLSVPPPNH